MNKQQAIPEGAVLINGRLYPDAYPPGLDRDVDAAWEVVDSVKGLGLTTRAFLAGQIVAAIMQARSRP